MFDKGYYENKRNNLQLRLIQKKDKLIRVILEEMRSYLEDDRQIGSELKDIETKFIEEAKRKPDEDSKGEQPRRDNEMPSARKRNKK